MPTIIGGVRLYRETDADWPERFRYLIDPQQRFMAFADGKQREARAKVREYGWYTARDARDDSPMLIEVDEAFQDLGPNSQSFHAEYWPSAMRGRFAFGIVDLVYHHVHGVFSVEPSATDRVQAKLLHKASPPLYFAQHGRAETDGEVYSHLYGVAELFPPVDGLGV